MRESNKTHIHCLTAFITALVCVGLPMSQGKRASLANKLGDVYVCVCFERLRCVCVCAFVRECVRVCACVRACL